MMSTALAIAFIKDAAPDAPRLADAISQNAFTALAAAAWACVTTVGVYLERRTWAYVGAFLFLLTAAVTHVSISVILILFGFPLVIVALLMLEVQKRLRPSDSGTQGQDSGPRPGHPF